MTPEPNDPKATPQLIPLHDRLPSGKSIQVRVEGASEEIQILSSTGEVEVSIALTDDGPVLQLRGVNLRIDATESVELHCKRFGVHTQDELALHTGGNLDVRSAAEIRLQSKQQTFIDGDIVNLNCLDRTGYHDDPARRPPTSLEDGGTAALPDEA